MPISYKNKIYTTLGTPTVVSGNGTFVTNSAGVPAKDYTVKGRTIVWNQLFTNSATSSNGVTISNNQDGTMTLNGTANVSWINFTNLSDAMNQVHKYLLCLKILNNPDNVSFHYGWLNRGSMTTGIISNGESCSICNQTETLTQGGKYTGLAGFKTGTVFNSVKIVVMVMDLTQMFGAGNEPATPAEFRAMFPDDYYPYNAGELKTIVPTSIEASGINLLNLVGRKEISFDTVGYRTPTDAYPEIDTHVYYKGVAANGYLSPGTVVEATVLSSSVIAKTGTNDGSAGYGVGIPLTVVPSTTYYIKCTTSGAIGIGYANSNKIITKFTGELSGSNIAITTPGDCRYILVVFKPNAIDTLATFENICVSAVQTNEYQPYKKYCANITSSKYFPDGMRSAGSAYDEINFLSQKAIKRVGVRPYQAGDENNTSFITDKKNTVYALSTPVETAITPPLQALSTFKGFTSFSAPNSLMKNGPLSVTYYVEGGANPEKGWLTSYKRKLYMGRNIEWNQLLDKSKFRATVTSGGITVRNNGDGTFTINGTKEEGGGTTWIWFYNSTENVSLAKKLYGHKILYGCVQNPSSGSTNNTWGIDYEINNNMTNGAYTRSNLGESAVIATLNKVAASDITKAEFHFYFRPSSSGPAVYKDVVVRPQLFDLTQMFGAGNEPATPEEFWTYFDHKLYPYNAGETQPLFKISRKSQWGSTVSYPNKGDLINIEGKQYRVLKTNGSVAEVLAMYNATNSQKFDTKSSYTNIYANNALDIYCNQTFYNSLSTAMQNAIVSKDFRQDSWVWDGGTSAIANYVGTGRGGKYHYTMSLMSMAYGDLISRKCYVLSVQDVIDYFEVTTSMNTTNTTLTDVNIWKMFWNQTTSPNNSESQWLRSAYVDPSEDGAVVTLESSGELNYSYASDSYPVRPAFQIDLSKVAWTKQG